MHSPPDACCASCGKWQPIEYCARCYKEAMDERGRSARKVEEESLRSGRYGGLMDTMTEEQALFVIQKRIEGESYRSLGWEFNERWDPDWREPPQDYGLALCLVALFKASEFMDIW